MIAGMPRKALKPTDFGKRLVALRRARGLTQVELAERISSTQRAISYDENHAPYPPAGVLADLARALQVSTDELLGSARPSKRRGEDPEARRLWKKFRRILALPEKDRRAIIRLINSLLGPRVGRQVSAGS